MNHTLTSDTYADDLAHMLWYETIAADGGLTYIREDNWNTDADIPLEWVGEPLFYCRLGSKRDGDIVLKLGGGLVRVRLHSNGEMKAGVAARDQASGAAIWSMVRTALPKRKHSTDDRLEVGFWYLTGQGPRREERKIMAPEWKEIADNYGAHTREALAQSMRDFRPSHGGQIVLWHGKPGTGKCVARGTRVITGWGYHRIEEMHPARTPDTAWEMVAEIGTPDGLRRTSHFYAGGYQATLRVTTRHGYEIEGTPEHPVLTLRPSGEIEWTRLCDLGLDDFLCVSRGTPSMWGNEHVPDAYILGLLIGDGHVSSGRRVTLTTADPELALEWQDYAGRHGARAFLRGAYDWSVESTDLVVHLDKSGVRAVLAPDKVVPEAIWTAPREDTVEFLRGLFDADAGVETRAGAIEFTSASSELVREVQLLLLKFGIIGRRKRRRVHFDYKGERRGRNAYRLYLSGENASLFYERIGFGLQRKQKGRAFLSAVHNTNDDVIPYLHGRIVGHHRLGHPSYPTLESLCARYPENAQDSTVAWSLAHRPLWSRVAEVVSSRAEVFDLTVPDGHSFIANGIVSHNTWALRSLCREWREWCSTEYIVDPDNAFGKDPAYLMQLLLSDSEEPTDGEDAKRWKLLILEDTGELIGEQAKAEAGQGLSRLLNVADGFLGQGLRVLVLITTNEEIHKLHPAVSRPGRAASVVLFDALTALESRTWLARHDIVGSWSPEVSMTLADLYAIAEQYPRAPEESRPVGFRSVA